MPKIEKSEITDQDADHPVRQPASKFVIGEEVTLADGAIGKVVDIIDGKYDVAFSQVKTFDEGELQKAT